MDKETPAKPEAGKPQPLEWLDGDMPYSTAFGDHFYCREDGRAECAYVFLDAMACPDDGPEAANSLSANLASAWPELLRNAEAMESV